MSIDRDPARPAAADVPRIEFEKFSLSNGLQVILHIDRKLPVVHVNQWFHVGSKNERRGRTGFAHLFEHIMFEGSANASDDYFTYVERAGANLREGGVNGTTDFDRTNYFATVSSGNLEMLLWVESDRLATLADALTQEKLDNQREIVRNERRQTMENVPYGRAFNVITENLHPADHPYSWDVIGSHEDLVAASLDDVKDFFRRFYTPNNLSLVIAGDFEASQVRGLVEKYFAGIPPGPAIDRMERYVPRLPGEKIVEVYDRVPQERTFITWAAPPWFERGQTELDLASVILSDGLASRLSRRLVYETELCSDVSAFNQSLEISGSFIVIATARAGIPLEKVESIVTDTIRDLARTGPTDEELERAKTKWEYNYVSGLERIGGFGGKADLLNQYNTFLGDPGKFDEDVARYRGATPASIREAVGQWLDTNDRLIVRFRPEESRATPVAALDRALVPALGEDRHFRAPGVREAKLDNGIQIYVVERRDLPKVAVSLVTRAGSTHDAEGKEGSAHMVAQTLAMGTGRRSALEIENALGDLGTAIDAAAAREVTLLSLDVLRRNLRSALAIVGEVVREAAFPAADFERERSRHLDALAQQNNNAEAVAGRLRPLLHFGVKHPYGRPVFGTERSIGTLERGDLVSFHEQFWRPASSAVVFAGDISLDEALDLASEALGSWVGEAVTAPQILPPAPFAGKLFLVDRKDAAQTIVSQILSAPGRSDADYYPFRLVDAIWGGGGFGTRLNLNLREDKGYTYGVFSNVAAHRELGIWWASGGVETDKTKESIVEFLAELEGLAGARPITHDELESARTTRVRGYAQQFESLGRVSGQVASLWTHRLPMTELQNEIDRMSEASLDEVTAAARRYARPADAILLLVGDLSKIAPAVRELGLGDYVVLDAEGRRVD